MISDIFPLTAAFPASGSRHPYLYILKSGSGIPYSLIYAKQSGTSSSPRGERKESYFLGNLTTLQAYGKESGDVAV
jgi:hypothetical protein